MAEAGGRTAFAVETVALDLPPLVGGFGRRLHDAGVPVTPGRAADLARALVLVDPIARRRLYWTTRTMCVTDPSHVPTFDRVFAEVFGGAARGDEPIPDDARTAPSAPDERPVTDRRNRPRDTSGEEPRAGVGSPRSGDATGDDDLPEVEVPLALASDEEALQHKRFDRIEPDELARLYRLMTRLELATPLRRTRRHEKGRHGERVDLRRTLRGSLRTAGDPIRLARRHRRIDRRRLVVLCDISGSMEPYARAYVQFLTCAVASGHGAEAFAFATRLTRLTRALAARNPERAIERAAQAAPDWSSGTRIGAALREFNDRHGRRGMARGAVVVIISDGWERGDPSLVGREMARLSLLAHRIVWVNPRVASAGFTPRSGGMAAALPYCDALVSGHSFSALGDVVAAIGAEPAGTLGAAGVRRLSLHEGDPVEEDTWASATPVAGSSVAMPSGYGPSRGRTTPGWSLGPTDDAVTGGAQ